MLNCWGTTTILPLHTESGSRIENVPHKHNLDTRKAESKDDYYDSASLPADHGGGAFSEITLRFTTNPTSENLSVTKINGGGSTAQTADAQVALTSCPDLSCNGDAWQQSDLQFIDDDTLGHVLALRCQPGSYRISANCPSISRARFATSPGGSESNYAYPSDQSIGFCWMFINSNRKLTTSAYSLTNEDWLTICTPEGVSVWIDRGGSGRYPLEVGYHPYQSTSAGGKVQNASLSFPSVLYTMTNIIEGVE